MLWPVAWQLLGKGRLSGDWSSLIRVQGKGPGGLANECNCPMSEKPFLNRYEGLILDLPPIQYRPTRKKSKSDILPSNSICFWLALFWHFVAKRARGTRLIILVCPTSWSNCGLKKQIQNYRGYIKVSVYYVLQREDLALNSMNQLTYWVLEFHSSRFYSFHCCFRTEKKKNTQKSWANLRKV